MHTFCLRSSFVVLSLLTIGFAAAESPALALGLSREKPAEGPFVEVDGQFMVPYAMPIAGTDIVIDMIPIPGGTFKMGSPEDEEGHSEAEGPQFEVVVDPMWVAKTETKWSQYKEYMKLYLVFKDFESQGKRKVDDTNLADAITAPTELYDPSFTFEYGEDPEQPAVTMTQYSAQQFTKWLSLISGIQYRLPTEAEWEYAARAGTTTAYSWGDGVDEIDQYAWYFDNADEGAPKVGTKAPNAFGLHDMHGSVAEWTINQYTENGYADFVSDKPVRAIDVVKWAVEADPCVARGGTWEQDAVELRSAARLASNDKAWKVEDPNFPRSPWWFTSDPARGVGFRIFRSYKPLDQELISKFWDTNSQDVKDDVESRVVGGRGGFGLVDKTLPEAIKELDK